ncbi:hypothetical protein QYE76_045936 [Lolium multiflorum]|uniref:Uncharacterized protein n=1 Tax=Lolium multiflorum TaxID=4521 RepID=A0AAD8TP02_LOLMU|nr:hypothetical protein QYE76_045936 [Lolium multiflorum]
MIPRAAVAPFRLATKEQGEHRVGRRPTVEPVRRTRPRRGWWLGPISMVAATEAARSARAWWTAPPPRTSVVVSGHMMEDNLPELDLEQSRLGFSSSLLFRRRLATTSALARSGLAHARVGMEDGTFVRDEEGEEAVQQLIYESARGPEPEDGDDNEFQDFLNDFGEGLESEQVRRDNEVSITNSGEVYIYPSGSSSKSVKTKRGPTRVLKGEGRLALTAFKDNGEPVEPKEFCRKFTSQSGVIVRDHVPISIQEWHKPKNPESGASYVNDAMKKFLWDTLMTKFSLPEDMTEGQKNKVKEWTWKKMAIQFQTFKKNLWDKYKNEDPVFDDNLVKIKDHWAAFKEYKKSSTFVSRSKKNTENAKEETSASFGVRWLQECHSEVDSV